MPNRSFKDKHEEASAVEMIDNLSIHMNKTKKDLISVTEAKNVSM